MCICVQSVSVLMYYRLCVNYVGVCVYLLLEYIANKYHTHIHSNTH